MRLSLAGGGGWSGQPVFLVGWVSLLMSLYQGSQGLDLFLLNTTFPGEQHSKKVGHASAVCATCTHFLILPRSGTCIETHSTCAVGVYPLLRRGCCSFRRCTWHICIIKH
ncbi:hypothetical protein BAUCODRAFT_333003 [Baudoinia panamericana UAMH 10762]|uniref:Uncharacterized protein n=1 Tax=Baudoinia panamericana (strain UAMH 10762) TaxID=717646 RepID=M2MWP8_BAUPA|nr:uncharacterized protein BAUCODRAFT_333003 [Baudoinia panamericana UAMH 10762]EMC90999.1 hypothetical protein BAUCODRAFT_333003 [Baudoinia panamericana UAMH 10762]